MLPSQPALFRWGCLGGRYRRTLPRVKGRNRSRIEENLRVGSLKECLCRGNCGQFPSDEGRQHEGQAVEGLRLLWRTAGSVSKMNLSFAGCQVQIPLDQHGAVWRKCLSACDVPHCDAFVYEVWCLWPH